MLSLTVKDGESVVLLDSRGNEIARVKLLERQGGRVMLGFSAPPTIRILREKLLEEPIRDTRPWVRDHDSKVWHYYRDQFGNALCGHPPIPGTPCVADSVGVESGGDVCCRCLEASCEFAEDQQ